MSDHSKDLNNSQPDSSENSRKSKNGLLILFATTLGDLPIILSSIAVLAMLALISLEVIMRNIFNTSTLIADEVGGYLMVLVSFMGLSYTFKSGKFVRVVFLLRFFSSGMRDVIYLISLIMGIIYSLILSYEFWIFVMSSFHWGEVSVQTLRFPLYIPRMFMALGTSFLAIQFFLDLIIHVQGTGIITKLHKRFMIRHRES